MKIAIVHDWLTGMRGGEKVLEALCELYPDADIFSLIHIKGSVSITIESHKIFTSFLQRMPFVETKYRYYLPLMPFAIERFNLEGYNLVISSSHCVAKGVKPGKDAVHICYCYTPMRYIWDVYNDYFGTGKAGFPVRVVMRIIRPFLRKWDVKSSKRVDHFIAISDFIAGRIKRTYSRDSVVIYPPVDTNKYKPEILTSKFEKNKEFYLVVSAFAPYKRIDIAVKAFNELGYKLKIVGNGQDENRLKGMAKNNVEFLGWQTDDIIKENYINCKALVFPGEEDFGIVPVEAMACGTPVIAYSKGGALETVIDGKTGVLFFPQTETELIKAINKSRNMKFDKKEIIKQSEKFSKEKFKERISEYIALKRL